MNLRFTQRASLYDISGLGRYAPSPSALWQSINKFVQCGVTMKLHNEGILANSIRRITEFGEELQARAAPAEVMVLLENLQLLMKGR